MFFQLCNGAEVAIIHKMIKENVATRKSKFLKTASFYINLLTYWNCIKSGDFQIFKKNLRTRIPEKLLFVIIKKITTVALFCLKRALLLASKTANKPVRYSSDWLRGWCRNGVFGSIL
jgi:hypothetical protein